MRKIELLMIYAGKIGKMRKARWQLMLNKK